MSTYALAQVARLFYVRGLTKLEIAERLGISRFKVTRLLEQAREQGVVRIEIDEPAPVDEELSAALERAFGLRSAAVVPAGQVARAAAAALPELVAPGEVLGVAWGRTLSETADHLSPHPLGATVVQICGAVAGVDPGTGPTEVAVRFADKLGGSLVALPAPGVTTALVGIGAHARGGHVLTYVFDADGHVEESLPAIALPLARLRRARVLAIAGGAEKAVAVTGALRSGLLDDLVTDVDCARSALAA